MFRGSPIEDLAVVLVAVGVTVVVRKEQLRIRRDNGKAAHVVENVFAVGSRASRIVALDHNGDLCAVPVRRQRHSRDKGLLPATAELFGDLRLVRIDRAVVGQFFQLDDARLVLVQVNVQQTVRDGGRARLCSVNLGSARGGRREGEQLLM